MIEICWCHCESQCGCGSGRKKKRRQVLGCYAREWGGIAQAGLGDATRTISFSEAAERHSNLKGEGLLLPAPAFAGVTFLRGNDNAARNDISGFELPERVPCPYFRRIFSALAR